MKNLKNTHSIFFLIILSAFLLRITFLIFLKRNYLFFDHPGSDVIYYLNWAYTIAQGDWLGSKVFFGLPLYPYFLAFLLRLSFGSIFLVYLIQITLGAINCGLIYLIAQKLFSRKIALLAGTLAAINFTLIFYSCFLMPVTLVIFLSLIIIQTLLEERKLKIHEWFILGILIGLAMMADGKFIFFITFLAVYSILKFRDSWRDVSKKILLPLVIGFMCVIFAVGLRNRVVGGEWIFGSAQTGFSFYVGNNPKATGIFENLDFVRPTHQGQDEDQILLAERLSQRHLNAAAVSRFWFKQGLLYAFNNPIAYFELLGNKFRLFLTDTERSYEIDLLLLRDWKNHWDINPLVALCPLAIIGLLLVPKPNQKNTAFLNIMILSQLIFTLVFFLNDRQRTYILPFLLIYEACALGWLIDQLKGRNYRAIVIPFIFLILFMMTIRPERVNGQLIDFLRFSKAGPIFEAKKDYAKAEENYIQALRYDPNDINTLYNLANCYNGQGDFLQARKYYNLVLELNPYHIDAIFNLGFLFEQFKKYDKAVNQYKKVIRLDNSSLDAYYRTAMIYQNLGQCQEAAGYYAQILKFKPDFAAQIQKISSACQPNLTENN